MKRTLLRSGLLLLLLVAVVALVPALRIRAVGWFRGEMFLRGMPYSHWVDRLGEPKTLGPAEDELKAAGASAVPLLVKMLQEPNPDLRWEAARILGDIGPAVGPNADLAGRALLSAMYDKDRDQRIDDERAGVNNPIVYDSPEKEARAKRIVLAHQAAERALVAIGPAAVPALIDGLKDPRRLTRADAARLLGGLRDKASAAGPPLAEALAHEPDGVAQWEECHALDQIGAGPDDLATGAAGVLDQAAPRVRRWAAQTLARLDPAQTRQALPALLKALEQPLDEDSSKAIDQILMRFGSEAVPSLVLLACGENDSSRAPASDALVHIGAPALPALAEAIKNPSPTVRRRAVHILHLMGGPAAPFVGSLSLLARDPDPNMRREAIAALAAIAPDATQTASAILDAVGDSDPAVQHDAVRLLTALPAGTSGAGVAVARAVKDPQVRADGIAAMKTIAPILDAVPDLLPILAEAARGRGVEPGPGRTTGDCQVDAIDALVSLGDLARPALPAVLDALKSDNPSVITALIAALPHIDAAGEQSIPFLLELLKNPANHGPAMKALLAVGATKQAFAAVAADIRSPDLPTAQRGIEWVYADRPHDRDDLLFDDVVPALVERLGTDALSTAAGNALEQLTSSPALAPALTRGLDSPDPKIARGSASVLEDIALYNRQTAAAPLAATALREALQNGKGTGDPELNEILTRAVRRLGSR
jgi:HEAT repeat protein